MTIQATRVMVYYCAMHVVHHEIADTISYYRHRVVIPGLADNTSWHSYQQLAKAVTRNKTTFMAATEYWGDTFPSRVFQAIAATGGEPKREDDEGGKHLPHGPDPVPRD